MLDRPVAFLTGGASGIGLALGRLLATKNMHVVLADVNSVALNNVAAANPGVETMILDVTDAAAVKKAVRTIYSRCGRLDYLFNNAGVGGSISMRQVTLAHWRRIVELNLMGVVHGIEAGYPIMVEQRFGHIVNTASISGLIPVPGQTLYNTTKYAIVGLSHSLRPEAARIGVKVSVVCPGAVKSSIWGTPILGRPVDRASPTEAIDADQAAAIIWRGVRANRATIVFPRSNALLAWLYRLHPGLLSKWFARRAAALD